MKIVSFAVCLVLVFWCIVASNQAKAGALLTVCELTARPEKYQSKNVEVSARVTGAIDALILRDAQCPTQSVVLLISNSVANKPDVAALWASIYREDHIGTLGKCISAVFVGKFHLKATSSGKHTLALMGVRNLDRRCPVTNQNKTP
jgi:hypothetical protein